MDGRVCLNNKNEINSVIVFANLCFCNPLKFCCATFLLARYTVKNQRKKTKQRDGQHIKSKNNTK